MNVRTARRMVEEIMSPGTTVEVETHAAWYPSSNEFHLEIEGGQNLVYQLPEEVTAAVERAVEQVEP
jgi:hypothetical protein